MKQERLWYRHDLSSAQRAALKFMLAGNMNAHHALPWVRLTTFRALHRLGLIRSDAASIVQKNSWVALTDSGRALAKEIP